MCSCNVSCMILVRWFFWTKMHICCQVGKNFSEHETHTYMVFIQMEVLVNQTFRLDFLCSLLLHASSISFSTFTCVEKTFNLMNFIHSDELAQMICHFQTSIHRPWTWLSLAWIAVISPNAPAAPVSPGSSVPVAVVPSGSSVPAAGTSSGIGALAIAHVPASQLRHVGGNWLLLPDLDLSLLLISEITSTRGLGLQLWGSSLWLLISYSANLILPS